MYIAGAVYIRVSQRRGAKVFVITIWCQLGQHVRMAMAGHDTSGILAQTRRHKLHMHAPPPVASLIVEPAE